MTANASGLSEKELAEWQYAHREALDAEAGELVDVDISPQLSVTVSFRLPGSEADAIRNAAAKEGRNLSDWIRRACAAALESAEAPGRKKETREALGVVADSVEGMARVIRAGKVTTLHSEVQSLLSSLEDPAARERVGTRSKGNVHVVPGKAGWRVVREGQGRAIARVSTQAAAIKRAREVASRDGVEFIIHDKTGRVRDRKG